MSVPFRTVLLSGITIGALVVLVVLLRRDEKTFTPLDVGARLVADVVYDVPGEPFDDAHRLDVYLPAEAAEPVPAVVWIHGGGWVDGDKTDPIAPWDWTDDGFAVVAINYRLAPEATIVDAATDVRAAIDHVRRAGADWWIDPNRIAVYGYSTGGHLAALAGASEAPLLGVVAAAAPLDLVRLLDAESATFVGLEGDDAVEFVTSALGCDGLDEVCRGRAQGLSPALLPSDTTPVLVIHGDADRMVGVDQARAHADAHGDNASVTVRIVPGRDHVAFRAEAEDFLFPLLVS